MVHVLTYHTSTDKAYKFTTRRAFIIGVKLHPWVITVDRVGIPARAVSAYWTILWRQ